VAWLAFGGVSFGAIAEVTARLANLPVLSAAAIAVTAAGVACGLAALRLWAAPLTDRDADAAWLGRFARTAYAWAALAALLLLGLRVAEAVGPVSTLHQHAFGGASRHALTVGFVSLMIVGVAWRILPVFSGAARPHPALVPTVFALLVTGNTLRVFGQVAAGLWGGAWYGVMGISGWLELAGVTLFGMDVLRLMRRTPVGQELPDVGEPVDIALEAPVGRLIAHHPSLLPVFARHGMGQVSSPLFQRTIGQRVTLLQACRRFDLEPEAFLEELRLAEERGEKQQCPA
jgi:hypothetical protein